MDILIRGCLEKLKNGKKVNFYPKNAHKIEKFLKSAIFKATDLSDSLKWPQENFKPLLFPILFPCFEKWCVQLKKMAESNTLRVVRSSLEIGDSNSGGSLAPNAYTVRPIKPC